jgi:hypothetical protein
MKPRFPLVFASLLLLACGANRRLPTTLGEAASGFGYVPLDGLAIAELHDAATCFGKDDKGAEVTYATRPLLQALPDISVRFAVASFSAEGALSFGPAKVTQKGGTYRAVLDYVNVDALPVVFFMRKLVRSKDGKRAFAKMLTPVQQGEEVVSYEVRIRQLEITKQDSVAQQALETGDQFDQVTVPVYVGIGMRLSADIRALKSGISLTSLGALAAEAQANALSGTLTVQTLGITGKAIATALPLPSKLDQTTVENGILALGSSRAVIYTAGTPNGDVITTPRVVGLYSPVGSDPRLINVIYSELSRNKPYWVRSCGQVGD